MQEELDKLRNQKIASKHDETVFLTEVKQEQTEMECYDKVSNGYVFGALVSGVSVCALSSLIICLILKGCCCFKRFLHRMSIEPMHNHPLHLNKEQLSKP